MPDMAGPLPPALLDVDGVEIKPHGDTKGRVARIGAQRVDGDPDLRLGDFDYLIGLIAHEQVVGTAGDGVARLAKGQEAAADLAVIFRLSGQDGALEDDGTDVPVGGRSPHRDS